MLYHFNIYIEVPSKFIQTQYLAPVHFYKARQLEEISYYLGRFLRRMRKFQKGWPNKAK